VGQSAIHPRMVGPAVGQPPRVMWLKGWVAV
jgi:hypothetical protein